MLVNFNMAKSLLGPGKIWDEWRHPLSPQAVRACDPLLSGSVSSALSASSGGEVCASFWGESGGISVVHPSITTLQNMGSPPSVHGKCPFTRSPGNRSRYSQWKSGLRLPTSGALVQVPVQAIGIWGLLPCLHASMHGFPDVFRDGRRAAQNLAVQHLHT